MDTRIENFIESFKKHGLDAFVVTKDVNIRYLTGFPACESWLLVSRSGTYYLTDFRYLSEVQKSLSDSNIRVISFQKSLSETVAQIAHDHKFKRIGFDGRHISYHIFRKLKTACADRCQLVAVNNLVENLRLIKTLHEIANIRQAVKLNLEAFRYVHRFCRKGKSEKDIFYHLQDFLKTQQVAFSFTPIIASGPNSCFPHARTSDRKLRDNEILLIDAGIDFHGYKSDLTRMFFLGKIPRFAKEIYNFVKRAQEKAIERVRPGIAAREVDQEARNYLKKNKLAKFFGHSLGHGIGLEVHEAPSISFTGEAIFRPGMVFTVEPAVYIPGKFGIRIEDIVVVTKKGCEVISNDRHQ